MNTITTTLTTSGNSVAVRLPKELLRLSGLSTTVTLEVKRGKIIISKPVNPRAGWNAQIKALIAATGEPTAGFEDLDAAAQDGLAELPWEGPSFQDWQKAAAKRA